MELLALVLSCVGWAGPILIPDVGLVILDMSRTLSENSF